MMDKETPRPTRDGSLAAAAMTIVIITVVARITGFGREIVMAKYFGAGALMDAFRAAYTVPNIGRILLAEAAVGAAFIPVFASYLAKKDTKSAWLVASSVINLLTLCLLTLSVLALIGAPWLIRLFAPGFLQHQETFTAAVGLSKILIPSLIFIVLAGLISGILNAFGHFSAPAAAPVVFNLLVIVMGIAVADKLGITGLALAFTIGAICQFILLLPFLKRFGLQYSFSLDWRHPGVREVGLMLLPILVSQGSIDINLVVDTRFASGLSAGNVATLGYAARIWTLPTGLFAMAVATVMFPTLAAQASLNNNSEVKRMLSKGLRTMAIVLIPITVMFLCWAVPLVRLVFEHGKFTSQSTYLTASAFFYYSIGIMATGSLYLINRVFYALKDTVTPMLVALVSIVINYFGDWVLIRIMPKLANILSLPAAFHWLALPNGGIALSTSIVSLINLFLLLAFLRRRLGGLDGGRLFETCMKTLVASVIAGLCGWVVWTAAFSQLGSGELGLFLSLFSTFAASSAVFIATAKLLRLEELGYIWRLRHELHSPD